MEGAERVCGVLEEAWGKIITERTAFPPSPGELLVPRERLKIITGHSSSSPYKVARKSYVNLFIQVLQPFQTLLHQQRETKVAVIHSATSQHKLATSQSSSSFRAPFGAISLVPKVLADFMGAINS